MTEIKNCLLRPPCKGSCCTLSFPKHNKMAQLSFEGDHVVHNHGAFNYLPTLPTIYNIKRY